MKALLSCVGPSTVCNSGTEIQKYGNNHSPWRQHMRWTKFHGELNVTWQQRGCLVGYKISRDNKERVWLAACRLSCFFPATNKCVEARRTAAESRTRLLLLLKCQKERVRSRRPSPLSTKSTSANRNWTITACLGTNTGRKSTVSAR